MVSFLLLLAVILGLVTLAAWWAGRPTYERISWNFDLDSAVVLDDSQAHGPPIRVQLEGNIPSKMCIQDSQLITVWGTATRKRSAFAPAAQDIDIFVDILAGAFELSPERRQRTYIRGIGNDANDHAQVEALRWSITPTKSGVKKHDFTLRAILLDGRSREIEVGVKKHSIMVTELLGLNASQLQWVRTMGWVLMLLVTAAAALVAVGA